MASVHLTGTRVMFPDGGSACTIVAMPPKIARRTQSERAKARKKIGKVNRKSGTIQKLNLRLYQKTFLGQVRLQKSFWGVEKNQKKE